MHVPMAAVSIVISMAFWMAVAIPVTHAGFLYVPQAETPAAAVEAVGSSDVEGAHKRLRGQALERSGEPGPDRWHVHPGEMLRDVLARWGGDAGVEVMFLTDRRYRLHEGVGSTAPSQKRRRRCLLRSRTCRTRRSARSGQAAARWRSCTG